MRILVLATDVPNTPRVPGSTRLYDLLRGLWARGHELTLVCWMSRAARWRQFMEEDGGRTLLSASYPVPAPTALSAGGRVRNLLSPRPPFDNRYRAPREHAQLTQTIARVIREHEFDVVHVDQLAMAQYVPTAWRGPLIVDACDAISLTEWRQLRLKPFWFLRGIALYQTFKVKRYEAQIALRANAYVVNSAPDRDYLASFLPRAKIVCIPSGVDTDYFHPAPDAVVQERQMVFTGSLAYSFNADGILHFHRTALPRVRQTFPDARVVVVGAQPPPPIVALAERDPLTTVTGYVPDVRPFVWTAALAICPLRAGTGIKYKVLNALALGKPLVATPASCEGIAVRDGEQLLIAAPGAAFAEAIIRLLNDPALRQRLAACGRAFVEREYSLSSLAARFEAVYLDMRRACP